MSSHSRTLLLGLLLGLCLTWVVGCSRTVERRDPTGQTFPSVEATRLTGEAISIPEDFAGVPVLLLIGYVQRAQFDIDRWLLGLAQAQSPVRVIEVPTIRGWAPRLISRQIDKGMRGGIPEEDWRIVATVYRDAPAIVNFLGNEGKNNARVVLLDAAGSVVWLHDRGYSATQLLELDERVREMPAGPSANNPSAPASGEGSSTMRDDLERFKTVMNQLSSDSIGLIEELYSDNVVFEDPLHRIAGREALRDYFARMYEGVAHCEFEFAAEVLDEDAAAIVWTMRMRHRNFRPDETLELPGMSFVRFENGRVVEHRDSFDVGAMIYERVPVLGRLVRYVKSRV